MKFILGKKSNMTQVFREDGTVVPVTRVQMSACVVTHVTKGKTEDVHTVQVGINEAKEKHVAKPQRGHLKDLPLMRTLRAFQIEGDCPFKRGDTLALDSFQAGDRVAVIGTSKGKGFQGVVKRHHFKGGPASHGHKDNLRMPGSIGAGGVQRVFKGLRMAGRMGGERVTVKNLEIVAVNTQAGELLIRGAVPGPRGSLVMVSGVGTMSVVSTPVEMTQPEVSAVETPVVAQEAPQQEPTAAAQT